jgi:hypothetical protein
MSKFVKHPKYSTGFDTAAYRMTVPEGYARYAVIEGLGPGGAGLNIATESAPAGAFQVDQLPTNWDPKPPAGTCVTIRIGAKKPGSGKIRLLFNGNDYSEPLPVQIPPDGDGTARSLQDAYQLSNRALTKAKERLEELRNSMIAATGPMPFQANWDVIFERYLLVANVLNLPNADLQPGQVNLNPKQKALFATAIPTITGALDRITKSLSLWGTGETPFLMRSDLEPDFAHVYGTSRDDRYYGIELEKLSFSHSGPLGRAATMLHERFHLTGAQHGENFFERKPKPQTGYETKQNAFRRVDNAEALAYLVCCLAAELIDPLQVYDRGR